MPSLRHSSATLSSPRSPAITILTFSSAEYCRRVARRISRTAFSASSECRSTADLISAPSAVTMSSNLSLPQSHQSVQLVLTGNNVHEKDVQFEPNDDHPTSLKRRGEGPLLEELSRWLAKSLAVLAVLSSFALLCVGATPLLTSLSTQISKAAFRGWSLVKDLPLS